MIDFLFSFVLLFGFLMILFAVSMTLSVVSVTQYMTFTSARLYSAAHFTPEEQEALARKKFEEMMNYPVFKPFFTNGWFEVKPAELQVGDMTRLAPSYPLGSNPERNLFWGVRTPFNAKMLDIRIPFWGSTSGDGDGFRTYIGSYLLREVTSQECADFVSNRWNAIRNLNGSYGQAAGELNSNFEDNGC